MRDDKRFVKQVIILILVIVVFLKIFSLYKENETIENQLEMYENSYASSIISVYRYQFYPIISELSVEDMEEIIKNEKSLGDDDSSINKYWNQAVLNFGLRTSSVPDTLEILSIFDNNILQSENYITILKFMEFMDKSVLDYAMRGYGSGYFERLYDGTDSAPEHEGITTRIEVYVFYKEICDEINTIIDDSTSNKDLSSKTLDIVNEYLSDNLTRIH